jgi:hypothetical protein
MVFPSNNLSYCKQPAMRIIVCLLFISCYAHAQKPPAGWQSLFNGKDLSGWHIAGGNAKFQVSADHSIIGFTTPAPPNTFLVTDKQYGDFILELDIMVEDSRMNSGVQVRSHFDAERKVVYGRQVELDPTDRRWSGGIYDEQRRLWQYPMTLNPKAQNAYKQNAFNHYRIECIGNETRTWINGVAAAFLVDTIDNEGFIGLQVHAAKPEMEGLKTVFKNIFIQTKNLKPQPFPTDAYVVNNSKNKLSPQEMKAGYQLLFDGKTSSGWKGAYTHGFPQKGWNISDGAMNVESSAGKEAANGGDVVTTKKYNAFDLSFQFKLSAGGNSGVKYFVTLNEHNVGSAIGLEFQVLDDSLHADAKLGKNGNRTLASLYDLIKAEKLPAFIRQPGNWNTGRVVVHPDNKVEHWLNGIKVLEYVRGSDAYKKLVADSKYKIWPDFGEAKEGFLLLQDHGDAVSYRSIRIKILK